MKRVLIIAGVLLVAAVGFIAYRALTTKSHSPEDNVNFTQGDLKVHVFYNRPFKKGRVIFAKDGLVPYGKVWRTGANEATVFETNKELSIGGKTLPAGEYSLWTIPNETSWTIIFNKEIPRWGVSFNGQAQRNPENDVLNVESPVVLQEKEFEQFTINVEKAGEEMELLFMWDKTLVATLFSQK